MYVNALHLTNMQKYIMKYIFFLIKHTNALGTYPSKWPRINLASAQGTYPRTLQRRLPFSDACVSKVLDRIRCRWNSTFGLVTTASRLILSGIPSPLQHHEDTTFSPPEETFVWRSYRSSESGSLSLSRISERRSFLCLSTSQF